MSASWLRQRMLSSLLESTGPAVNCVACGTPVSAHHNYCPYCGIRRHETQAPMLAAAPQVRQTTVLLCDIVDSTALTNALDPEDAREVLVQAQRCIKRVVQRYKGPDDHAFDRDVGDSQLFCFGLPHAQEDAADRAVAAALETIAEIKRLQVVPGVNVAVRIGVATGVVVVGQTSGDETERKPVITGAAPNLAARLQAAASPNTIVISPTTRLLVGEQFYCHELGLLTLKGFEEPVKAWRVDGPRQVTSRFEAMHPLTSLSPLVGREREIGALLDGWELVREGAGHTIAISGEPGIGKSRILRVVLDRLQAEVSTVLQLQCSPYHVNTAFYPVARGLERLLHNSMDGGRTMSPAVVEAALSRDYGLRPSDAALVAQVLAIAVSKTGSEGETPLPRSKQDTITALLDLFEALARRGRCLVLFEDAHWADPSSNELLRGLAARAARIPLLVLITHRPEFEARRLGEGAVGQLVVSRLTRPQSALLATRLAADRGLPAPVVDRIVERSDGIPLFVEELTKATIESAGGAGPAGRALPDVPVPASLRDSLMSRLDRLSSGRAVAQIGAVIGREFSRALLCAVAPLNPDEIEMGLTNLSQAGLTSMRGSDDGPVYVFKHALLQDIARDSLLRSARRQLNAQIAQVLEDRFQQTAQAQPELMAHYCSEAGLTAQAVEYLKRAGDHAAQRSANQEALNQLEKALHLVDLLPEGPPRRQQELELRTILARTLAASKGYAAADVEEAFARARALFPQVNASAHKFVVLRGECQMLLVRARYDDAFERAHQVHKLALREQDLGHLADSHLLIGVTQVYRGELLQAREHLQRCIQIYDPALHLPHSRRQGADMRSAAMAYLARVLWLLGEPDQALQCGQEAVERARSSGIPLSVAQACGMLTLVQQARRDLVATRSCADETLRCAREMGQPYWITLSAIVDSWLQALAQPSAEATAAVSHSIDRYRSTGSQLGMSWALLLLAEGLQAADQIKPALQAIADALDHIDRTREMYYAAEVHRRRGELLWLAGDAAGAMTSFMRALAIAREQQAKGWELRAATSLARARLHLGQLAAAREALQASRGKVTEGAGTADWVDADALLLAMQGSG